ncbi:hypothetical protein L226DRAFT_564990 [Lentinus tigrinus ALCF2SS1-7]|uniref:uncharacterized protein n=1 Tax=Lentinus tigrinus ALCF2SS1-7 TaxID=1328758 RepID=UPI001166211F|nr:hypothetical protein L226DRAFT_564990 [Lentinus tigrinus ALCF2SS1-7]
MPSKFLHRDRAWGTRYDTLGASPPSSPTLHRSPTENVQSSTLSPTPPRELQPSADDGISGLEDPPAEKPDLPDTTPHDASIFVGSLPANVDHIELGRRLYDHLSAYPQIKGVKVVRDSRGGVCAFVQCHSPLAAGELLASLQAHPPLPFLSRFLRFEPAKAYRTLLLSYRTPAGFASAHTDGLSDGNSSAKLRLAYAMRIFRPRNAKYLSLVYDEDATNFSAAHPAESSSNPQHDRFMGEGFLINPLKYDGETLRALAAAFGPLESFKELASGSSPSPHDATHSPEMAQGVWEVKWRDREDSVTALLTLRRVPHLNVSWAHHPPNSALPHKPMQQSGPVMPSSLQWNPTGVHSSPDECEVDGHSVGVQPSRVMLPTIQMPPPTPSGVPCLLSPGGVSSIATEWSTIMSPSLDRGAIRADTTRWADQMADLDFSANGAFPSQPGLHTSTPILRQHPGSVPPSLPQEPNELFQPIDQCTDAYAQCLRQSSARRPPTVMDCVPVAGPTGRDLLGSPRITGESRVWANHAALPPSMRVGPRELDPTTVFVGGLEVLGPDAWDENKLRRTFGRFGNIENVHIVAPLNKRTAFAFIKYASEVSASRAVREEHNRVHGGRPIRVQLRDRNGAPRGFWRPGRGRGRGIFGTPHSRQEPMSSGDVHSGAGDAFADMLADAGLQESAAEHSGTLQGPPIRASPSDDRFAAAQPTGLPASERAWPEGFNHSFSSLSSSTTKVPSVNYEMSHGPPSTTASLTPPPSNLSVSTSASSRMPPPYPVNMGYYPPHSWVQPYPAAYPYPVPVVPGYGYPGYPYAPVHAMTPGYLHGRDPVAPPPTDSTGSQWTGVVSSDCATKDMTGSAATPSASGGHMSQPPLRATGFIQNEQGALIPVYQREALDEYMAHAHGRQPPPPTQTQSAPQAAGRANTPPDGIVWQAPPLAMYHPVQMQSVPSLPVAPTHVPTPPHPRFWMPGAIPYGVPAFHPQSHHAMPGPVMHVAAAPPSPSSTSEPCGTSARPDGTGEHTSA